MWKHRAYAKALIRQETIHLKHSEQLILLYIADHCNEQQDETSLSNARLADMSQSASETVRAAIKTLKRLNVLSVTLQTGRAPVYHLPIPDGFDASSDTDFNTPRANMLSSDERAQASQDRYLKLIGMTAKQMAVCVFQGVEGMSPQEAKRQADKAFEGKNNPSKVLLDQVALSMATPVKGEYFEEDLSTDEAIALAEQRDKELRWAAPKSGETEEQYQKRLAVGYTRWTAQKTAEHAVQSNTHNALGK